MLELARVAENDEEQADAHRRGIAIARAERGRRIAVGLEKVTESIRQSTDMSNYARVANPFSSQAVTRKANEISKTVADFAARVELEFAGGFEAERRTWRRSAKGFLGDTAKAVGTAGSTVAGGAKKLGEVIHDRAEDSLIERAERIKARRAARSEDSGPAIETLPHSDS